MLPPQASTYAAGVDDLYYFLFWLSVFFFVGIVGAMTYLVLRYARTKHEAPQGVPAHHQTLEVTWTVIPTIIVLFIFAWGFWGFMDMRVVPEDAMEIQVQASSWAWQFTYPNGGQSPELHVPVGEPVRLVLSSKQGDVIHSLYIPAFRTKMDCVPGRYNYTWFEATKEGNYRLYCTEYCGRGHSQMSTWAVVESNADYNKFLQGLEWDEDAPPEVNGEKVYLNKGCKSCHTVDGSKKVGPSFYNSWGKEVPLQSGGTVVFDENYVRESIYEPSAKIHQGYPNKMPKYTSQDLGDREINALIAYFKTLKPEAAE